jgi:hypothetical protein
MDHLRETDKALGEEEKEEKGFLRKKWREKIDKTGKE